MSGPVILSSGHTFDRASIQRWLDSGHRTCPITKLPLPEHPLAVVEVNKAIIGENPDAILGLVRLLIAGKGREKKEAATALYAICSYAHNRRRAIDCGAVPILIGLLDSGLERAIEVLGLLVKCKEGREEMKKVNGCFKVLIEVLRNGSSRGVQYGKEPGMPSGRTAVVRAHLVYDDFMMAHAVSNLARHIKVEKCRRRYIPVCRCSFSSLYKFVMVIVVPLK
ncbi:U-box domain-containing protein 8 [Hibiscus syriacus]|uniref:RING-type E3 ubiquitin transferase n=1 Tax=Hibiscus syriacus TaxID=106335 RepID=A0A6A3BJC4_HIBSY|nr:U-box domain-containing protein 8 [Hibiscus syriacus]